MNGGIVRGPRAPYTPLPNSAIRDKRLSYRARGVLARLLSNQEGYSMTAVDLAKEGREGRDAIQAALRELRETGYLVTTKSQKPNGTWITTNTIYETPKTGNQLPVSQRPEFRQSEFQAVKSESLKELLKEEVPPPSPNKQDGGEEVNFQIDWPPSLQEEDRAQIISKTTRSNRLQVALDEYRAAVSERAISNPFAWILKAYESGTTTPSGRAFAKSRIKERNISAEIVPSKIQNPDIAKSAILNFKNILGKARSNKKKKV